MPAGPSRRPLFNHSSHPGGPLPPHRKRPPNRPRKPTAERLEPRVLFAGEAPADQAGPSARLEADYTFTRNGEVEFAILYADDSGVDPSSLIGNDNVLAVRLDAAQPTVPARYVSINGDTPAAQRTVVYRATLPAGTTLPANARLWFSYAPDQVRDVLGNAGVPSAVESVALFELPPPGPTGPGNVPPNVKGTLTHTFTLAGEPATTPLAGRRVYADANGNGAFDLGEVGAITGLDGGFGFFAEPGHVLRVEASDSWSPAAGSPATAPVNLRPNFPQFALSMAAPVIVDVLVAYAASASSGSGFADMPSLAARVRDLMLGTNRVFANSDTNTVLNLAGLLPVFYTSPGFAERDVVRLRKRGDVALDEVHVERDRVGADVTVLVTTDERRDRTLGIAYQLARPGGEPENAFAVVSGDDDPLLFAHEAGHLFGAGHERAIARRGVRPYAHGFVHAPPVPDAESFMDVMSYGFGRRAPPLRLPFLSTPRLTYNGVALGDAATADNARTVRELAPVVAGYRAAPPGGPAGAPPSVDLEATVEVTPPRRTTPGAPFTGTVTLTNRGTASAVGRGSATWYLSTDATQDGADALLQSVGFALNLKPGQAKRQRVRLRLPTNLAAGTYYVLAAAGGGATGIDTNPANNNAVGPTITVT